MLEESPLELARRWLAIVARDIRSARILAPEEPPNSVFFSQQAAEKSYKAILAARSVAIPKIHDLRELGKLCVPLAPGLTPLFELCASLSDYAVVVRYVETDHDPDEAEAFEALAKATALYDAVRAELKLP
jgi:HEPN domain-containing protein